MEELALADAAYLAGLPAPEQADAERNPEEAYARRRSVLDAMLEEGYINAEQHEAVDNTQWNINPFGLGTCCPGPRSTPSATCAAPSTAPST